MNVGDYVLATKYSDGDPQDHWAVGYYVGITAPHYNPPRYDVADADGKLFRGNGFRRVEPITPEQGTHLLENARDIVSSGQSVWYFFQPPAGAQIRHEDNLAAIEALTGRAKG